MNQISPANLVVVHCHIFKNAGSTFDWSLRRSLGSAFSEYRIRRARPLGSRELARILATDPAIRAISAHSVALPLQPIPGFRLLPALFIRHPIERAYSIYMFERRQPEDTAGSRKAKQLSFSDYVSWRLTPESAAVLRDYQTRFCSGMLGCAPMPMTAVQFRCAHEFLENNSLVGVVDEYDRSMVLFERHLAQLGVVLNLEYVHQNTGRYPGGWRERVRNFLRGSSATQPFRGRDRSAAGVPGRAAWVLTQLPPRLAERLLEANQYDLQLHDAAHQRVAREAMAVPDFDACLAVFRRRCRSLQKVA